MISYILYKENIDLKRIIFFDPKHNTMSDLSKLMETTRFETPAASAVLHMVPLTIYSLQKIKQIHTVYTLDV
jgi:hypothetical protein